MTWMLHFVVWRSFVSSCSSNNCSNVGSSSSSSGNSSSDGSSSGGGGCSDKGCRDFSNLKKKFGMEPLMAL